MLRRDSACDKVAVDRRLRISTDIRSVDSSVKPEMPVILRAFSQV